MSDNTINKIREFTPPPILKNKEDDLYLNDLSVCEKIKNIAQRFFHNFASIKDSLLNVLVLPLTFLSRSSRVDAHPQDAPFLRSESSSENDDDDPLLNDPVPYVQTVKKTSTQIEVNSPWIRKRKNINIEEIIDGASNAVFLAPPKIPSKKEERRLQKMEKKLLKQVCDMDLID